jgi:regulator of nonsense transcripts 2
MVVMILQSLRWVLPPEDCPHHSLFKCQDNEPEPVVVLSTQENLGPSEEADAAFVKELAKMVSDSSAESRKIDKKTALALWDSAVPPSGLGKKRIGDIEDHGNLDPNSLEQSMNFTVITKRGNKQQVCFLVRSGFTDCT